MKGMKRAFRFVASMKAGLILLSLAALYLIAGTLFARDTYAQSVLFKVLLCALMLNMVSCTLRQIIRFLCAKGRRELREAALILLHGGLVLALLGGVWGAAQGVKTRFALFEGEARDLSEYSGGRLSLSLTLDSFEILLNDDGSAGQYCANFHLTDEEGAVTRGSAQVNRPFAVNGVKLYYGEYMDGLLTQTRVGNETGEDVMLGAGETVPLPEGAPQVQIVRYAPDYDPQTWESDKSVRKGNERVVYTVTRGSEAASLMVAPLGEWIRVEEDCLIRFDRWRPYVVFMVKYDPGLKAAAIGSIMLVAGTSLLMLKRRNRDDNPDTPERTCGRDPVYGGGDSVSGGEKT